MKNMIIDAPNKNLCVVDMARYPVLPQRTFQNVWMRFGWTPTYIRI
jgi:hypothetical protein